MLWSGRDISPETRKQWCRCRLVCARTYPSPPRSNTTGLRLLHCLKKPLTGCFCFFGRSSTRSARTGPSRQMGGGESRIHCTAILFPIFDRSIALSLLFFSFRRVLFRCRWSDVGRARVSRRVVFGCVRLIHPGTVLLLPVFEIPHCRESVDGCRWVVLDDETRRRDDRKRNEKRDRSTDPTCSGSKTVYSGLTEMMNFLSGGLVRARESGRQLQRPR